MTKDYSTAPRLVATDMRGRKPYAIGFTDAHTCGVPHRAVHVVISDERERLLTFSRRDGRREILGGHCDWLPEGRAESFEEAGIREITEELALVRNWHCQPSSVASRLRPHLIPLCRTVNALQSSHGQNVELVIVYELPWAIDEWGDPETFVTSEEHDSPPQWITRPDLELWAAGAASMNSALRLHLHRLGVLW